MSHVCIYCQALKFNIEAKGMCYAGGKIKLPHLEAPPEPLKTYFLGLPPNQNTSYRTSGNTFLASKFCLLVRKLRLLKSCQLLKSKEKYVTKLAQCSCSKKRP
ncbi:hypothetical protein TNCV_4283491 [Trichonephila clavipes]|nr:hypothetical protein TNCV_4283491 [Trichonephila clavipes]